MKPKTRKEIFGKWESGCRFDVTEIVGSWGYTGMYKGCVLGWRVKHEWQRKKKIRSLFSTSFLIVH